MQIISREIVHQAYLTVEKVQVSGNGAPPYALYSVERGESVAVLVFDKKFREFIFVEQFRYPAFSHDTQNTSLLELIAGMKDKNETPEVTAKREALEETGYEVLNLKHLHSAYLSPGVLSEFCHIFYAELGEKKTQGGGLAEENESIKTVRINVERAYDMLYAKAFNDIKIITALHAVKTFNLI